MNTYHAFYNGKKIELQAPTTYAAQQAAAKTFKAKKSWQVSIVLVATATRPGQELVNLMLA